MFKTVRSLSDVVSHFIYCTHDNTVLFTIGLKNNNEYHLPSINSPPSKSWIESSRDDLIDIFDCEDVKLHCILRHYRVYVPDHLPEFINHVVYGVKCDNIYKLRTNNPKVRYRGKLKWLNEAEVNQSIRNHTLASPEILELMSRMRSVLKINTTYPSNFIQHAIGLMPDHFTTIDNFVEVSPELIAIPEESLNPYDQLVNAADFHMNVANLIYREFLLRCFPYMFMSSTTFTRFMIQLGWERDGTAHLFRAADTTGRNGITYKEFLYILAAIEPSVIHRGVAAEVRCRYIHRYFDEDNNEKLNYAEFKKFIVTLRRVLNESLDAVILARDIDGYLKSMNISVNNGTCNIPIATFLNFTTNVLAHSISAAFRSRMSIRNFIYDLQERERPLETIKTIVQSTGQRSQRADSLLTEISTCTEKPAEMHDYSFAIHTVRFQKNPMKVNVDEIFAMCLAVSESEQLQTRMNPTKRTVSFDAFNQKSLTNQLLKMLRFNMLPPNSLHTNNSGTNILDVELFGKNLIKLCEQVRNIVRHEPRLLEIKSPVYVLGDLHGNYADLMFFEKLLWHMGPSLCTANVLFLGDYVDRGAHGVEVVTYLFSYKMQCPTKFYLLRGNHEIRNVQKAFTFEGECNRKFGAALGKDVWNAVNSVFDALPLTASIDSTIFCCHGGIPPPWLCPVVSAINTIPAILNDPNVQSPLAWEIMWNDPLQAEQLTESILAELIANEGFAANMKRGTGHMFSVQALERFLKINGFSHVIRAHEYAQSGFTIKLNGRLLTVFSTSQYCGSNNEAACVIVDQRKMRLLRLAAT